MVAKMASSSQEVKGKIAFEIQLVSNEVKQLEFKVNPKVAYKNDLVGPLSLIPSKVVMIQDVHKCYNCKVGSISHMELRDAYDKLCDNVVLKEEFSIVEKKG